MSEVGYVELQVATCFSFLRGASHPDELLRQAKALGYTTLGITDYNSVSGLVRAHDAACEQGVRLIPGARLELEDGATLLAYPRDRDGWASLCRLLTLGARRGTHDAFQLRWQDLAREARNLVLILLPTENQRLPADMAQLAALARQKDDGPAYVALTRRFEAHESERLAWTAQLCVQNGVRPVVTGDVLWHDPSRQVLHDVMTAIRCHRTLETLGADRDRCLSRHLRSPNEISVLFPGYEDALARSQEIAAACQFSLEDLRYQYPDETEGSNETPQAALERLVRAGVPYRYPTGTPADVRQQLDHELALIARLEYAPYFLTVNTIVAYARSRGILCQGRGSAANSAVCYVLGITAIDPVRSGLLFERFVSEERREPPDIDVDFEADRREEVIQWIYRRYGRSHAALCATLMRFQPKGALREVGKAFGLPEDLLGQMSKHLASVLHDDALLAERLGQIGLSADDRRLSMVLQLARLLVGFPRQYGTHPGGFVLTADRLDELVPVRPAAMAERQTLVWDKDDIDRMRMMKVDVLGLGMLGCLRRCFELIQSRYHSKLDMATIPPEDRATYQMIARADTLGTFQIESRAQMAMLPRTKPVTFYDLVVQVAIVRPGPITGDMVHPYLRRRAGEEAPDCPSPALQRILGKTLGIPLFQEQAMQVAVHCAGFTGGEADQLRRSMGTFRSTGGVHHMKERLLSGMIGNGYDPAFATQIWTQLEGFGAYGFPESHAASFALIAYASAWLKCHYPDVFCAALLNSQPMGFYAPAQIVRDAREHGVEVRPVCINASRWDCTLEASRDGLRQAVRLGFRLVSGLSCEAMARLILARGAGYDSLDDVWRRSDVPLTLLEKLAEADAFHALGANRRQALWTLKGFGAAPLPLFEAADRGRNAPTPELSEPDPNLPEVTPGSAVVEDYHATGLSLRAHPISFLRDILARQEITPIADLAQLRDGTFVRVAGLVLMRQRPSTANGVMFMTIEDETGTANLVFWKDRITAQRATIVGSGFIAAHGLLQREGEVIHVVVRFVEDLQPMLSRLSEDSERTLEARSRNFR